MTRRQQDDAYDRFPYPGWAFPETAPGHLAVIARLAGLHTGDPNRPRVLELGCGMGANLLAQATAYPRGHFVGVDLSARHVEAARETAAAAGIGNATFVQASVEDLPRTLGRFGFVIAHGVYSWVPQRVRRALLAAMARHLAPDGVAYVSYNALPGWAPVGALRQVLLRDVDRRADPVEQVRAARRTLRALSDASGDIDTPWRAFLRNEARRAGQAADSLVFHDLLATENEAFHLHEVAAAAAEAGLRAVADALPEETAPETLGEAALRAVRDAGCGLPLDLVADTVAGRRFRRTVLVAAERTAEAPPPTVEDLWFSAVLRPTPEAGDAVRAGQPVPFTGPYEFTARPETGALLLAAAELGRGPTDAPTLVRAACDLSGVSEAILHDTLRNAAVPLARVGGLRLHPGGGTHLRTAPARPRASPLARHQAACGLSIVNLRLETVTVDDSARALLPLLDGSHDRDGLVALLCGRVAAGQIQVAEHGHPVTEPARQRRLLDGMVAALIAQAATEALLLDPNA